jgi:hypothetical protein
MAWYEGRSAGELLEELSVRIYESPLLELRLKGKWPSSAALRNLGLFLDFDTEVSMQGMVGFLENQGLNLPATIEMFRTVGAQQTAEQLVEVQRIMDKHGITAAKLRADVNGRAEFEITTFRNLHGSEAAVMAEEVTQVSQNLYLNRPETEDVYALVEAYIAKHLTEVISSLEDVCA